MIDIENRIYSGLRQVLSEVSMSTDLNAVPSSFPHVALWEADNVSYEKTQDSGIGDNHVSVMYEINIYSGKSNGRKQESKELLSRIDDYMLNLGFNRISKTPVIESADYYRLVVRYTAIVSKNYKIYRR